MQRFATLADLETGRCTIEEREEYEPHIRGNTVVYAGVDYEAILRQAEQEADADSVGWRQQRHALLPLRPGNRRG